MNKVNWNELRDKVHQNAIDKGFWEDERSIAECLALIHSEVSEALEADRMDRHLANEYVLPDFWREYQLHLEVEKIEKETPVENRNFKYAFEEHIKDTFEDELADVVIRCLDLCGHLGNDVSTKIGCWIKYNSAWKIPEHLFFISRHISNAYDDGGIDKYRIGATIYYILLLSKDMNIDLLKHIELKMKYNSLRPHKHGKKY